MTKLVENFGKILVISTIAILFYTFFVTGNSMVRIYAIGAMMLGVLIIDLAQNDFKIKIEEKDALTYSFIVGLVLLMIIAYLN